MNFLKIDAAVSLVPGAEVLCTDGVLTWINPSVAPVTDEEIEAELIRLQQEYDSKEYQRLRQVEYPPVTDYLDGIVKNDQAQIDKYISDCLAVKAKYPKPQSSDSLTEDQTPLE